MEDVPLTRIWFGVSPPGVTGSVLSLVSLLVLLHGLLLTDLEEGGVGRLDCICNIYIKILYWSLPWSGVGYTYVRVITTLREKS